MGIIRWIIGCVIAILIAVFTSANLHNVDVFLTPIHGAISIPLYLVGLGLMALGFLMGAGMIWFSTLSLRYQSHKQRRVIKVLEQQVEKVDKSSGIIHKRRPMGEFFPAMLRKKKNIHE